MRVAASTPDSIELRGRGSVNTPFIVGCILVCWPALASLMAGSPPTGDRLSATVALVALGSTFAWLGRPKPCVIRLRPRERLVEVRGKRPWAVPEGATLRLIAAPAQPAYGPLRYGVTLEAPGNEPLLVLVGKDPARVLGDVARLCARFPLPVRAGWGVSRAAIPWLDAGPAPTEETLTAEDDDPVEPSRRRAMAAVGVGTAGAAAALALEIHGRFSQGDILSPISLALPALAICVLAVLTVVLGTLKPRLHAGADFCFEWRLGALRLFPRSVPMASVRSAVVVSPTGRAGRHLLMSLTSGEFVAFPCEPSDGMTAAARLTPGAERAP